MALGVPAVCGFVGRNVDHDMDQNIADFEAHFIPLLKAAPDRGLEYRVEQCPMPGWNTTDAWHNNIAYTPGMWIRLHRIAEKHGCGDAFRIHYDPSHAILMGQNTRDIFQFLKDEGYNFLIGGFHVKGQVVHPKGVAEWGYGGQTADRGDRMDGKPNPDLRKQGGAWLKQVVLVHPRAARHRPARSPRLPAEPHGRLAGPPAGGARAADVQERHRQCRPDRRARVPGRPHPGSPRSSLPILQGSCAFTRAIDEAAASMFALHSVLESQGIKVQGVGREAYRS